ASRSDRRDRTPPSGGTTALRAERFDTYAWASGRLGTHRRRPRRVCASYSLARCRAEARGRARIFLSPRRHPSLARRHLDRNCPLAALEPESPAGRTEELPVLT